MLSPEIVVGTIFSVENGIPFFFNEGILYIILPVSGIVLTKLIFTIPVLMPISVIIASPKSKLVSVISLESSCWGKYAVASVICKFFKLILEINPSE